MTTIIVLNEWTEVEVKESRAEIRKLIRAKVWVEKSPYKWEDFHFIELNMINSTMVWVASALQVPTIKVEEMKIDLYFKRILFIYEK